MKQNLLISAVSALLVLSSVQAKAGDGSPVKFTYDSNGNVTSKTFARTIKSAPMKRNVTPEDKVTVSPNPTDGIFCVERLSGCEDGVFTYSLYGLNSQLIETRQTADRIVRFDLSMHADGIYILRVSGADYTNNWKVIKK